MFYKKILFIALPVILKNTLSSFSGFVDNLMVGSLGANSISAVAIINQIFFIFYCTFLGTISVVGIFNTQYFGIKNYLGVKKIFQIKIIISLAIFTIFSLLLYVFYDILISIYMTNGSENMYSEIKKLCNEYLFFTLLSLIPFIITQIFTSTMNESGTTFITMILSIISISINTILNYLLINGLYGFPKLGLTGASLATFIGRFVELICALILQRRFLFFRNIFKNIEFDKILFKSVVKKCIPTYINEFLFSFSFLVISQIYSYQSTDNVVIMSIVNVVVNFFFCMISAIGYSSEILIGHQLGLNDFNMAFSYAKKSLIATLFISTTFVPLIYLTSYYIPMLYDIPSDISLNATKCIKAFSLTYPLISCAGVIFYILRSGGKIFLLYIIDSGYFWLIAIPTQFILIKTTNLEISKIYFIVSALNLLRCIVGLYLLNKKIWMKNIINNT